MKKESDDFFLLDLYYASITLIRRNASEIMERLRRLRAYLFLFDIFSSEIENDEAEKRVGRLATRVYIFIFTVILILYALFNILPTDTALRTVSNPSQSDFERLQTRYPHSLTCPCSEIAVQYRSFIHIIPIIHPVCSSGFVTNEWLSYMTNTVDRPSLLYVRISNA